MSFPNKYKPDSWSHRQLDNLRLHLARPDALIQLSILGVLTGLLTGGIIVLFRILVEEVQLKILTGHSDNYETLSMEARFLYPVIGSLIIALIFHFFSKGIHVLGVASVMERMAFHQGYLSLRGFFLQFFGAAVAIISGHSVGREGPNVYLGAASSSLVGQFLGLPNNSIRTLVGCGTAAGIAASFDTPLAGVIFALEVIMMEYTLVSFMPIILAAGSATSISIFVFGSGAAFTIPKIEQGALIELPFVVLLGLLAGVLSAFFIELLKSVTYRSRKLSFSIKLMLSGMIVGLIAMIEPGVMGIGYDSVSQTLAGDVMLSALLLLLACKLLATAASIGLGIPGGVIGPALFLGACLGGVLGLVIRLIFPELQIDTGFYSLLGMGAVMGASLQAPLAALTAMMELTHSPQIIMPGMITIVIANLTASELFRKKSLFISVLEANEVNVYTNPISQTLRRIGVGSVMNKTIAQVNDQMTLEKIKNTLSENPEWLLIADKDNQYKQLMPAIELVKYVEQQCDDACDEDREDSEEKEIIDLLEIPARRIEAASIHLQATLEEALNKLDNLELDALYVERMNTPGIMHIYGVLTREQIESAYQFK
ncbi:MAG: chloride channel protein [Gammaproteobacteria bacterium]|nr:chloride channel protein [Gammaproteobacteria bacterium]